MDDQSEDSTATWRGLLSFAAGVLVIFFGRDFFRAAFPQISPGLAICLMIVTLFAVAGAANAITRRRQPIDAEQDGNVLARLVPGAFFAIAMGMFLTASYIRGNAPSQPDGSHTVLVHEKGGDIYLTPEQSKIDDIALAGFLGSIACGAAVNLYFQRARRK
jgi:hypothetical protein